MNGLFSIEDIGMFANGCEQYGIVHGCDINCPVLQDGKCELKYSDNKELYKQWLEEIKANNMNELSAMHELRNFIRSKHESGIYKLMTVDLLTFIECNLLERDNNDRRKIAEDSFDTGNKHGFDIAENSKNETIYPNKETFVNNLLKK